MSLLSAPTVKNSHIQAKILFIFLSSVLNKLETLSVSYFNLSENIEKAVTR